MLKELERNGNTKCHKDYISYPKAGLSALLSGVFTRPPAVDEELELRFYLKAIYQAPGSGTGALLLEVREHF